MMSSSEVAIVSAARAAVARAEGRRVEKPAKSLSCGADPRKGDDSQRQSRSGYDRRRSSRRGTDRDVPFWDGPRLRAPFVTQVIAQVIGDTAPDTLSAMSAYAHPWRGRANLLLDDNI